MVTNFILISCVSVAMLSFFAQSYETERKLKLDGDIVLGGLFPMHEMGMGGIPCGKIKEEKGIQRMEAMLYTVMKINNDTSILPGIDVGVHILDTCLRDTYALEQSMDFIKGHMSTMDVTDYQCKNGKPPEYYPFKPVLGVIGAAASSVSIMVANILRLFKIPQISYASTSSELSDNTRYEYFSRVVPPDTYQAQAMVEITKELGWTYVTTLADEGLYGEKGIQEFERKARMQGICVSKSLQIPREASNKSFDNLVTDLAENADRARGIVMYVNEDNCRRLLEAVIRNNRTDDFNYLASDSWGAKVHPVKGREMAAESAITVLPKREVVEGFDEYFTSLRPEHHENTNPWFAEFWEYHFDCNLPNSQRHFFKRTCLGNETISAKTTNYEQEGAVQFVVDAVYAMVKAIDNYYKEQCNEEPSCLMKDPPIGPVLLQYIRNVSFIGTTGDVMRFNEHGDGFGRYNIYQYQSRGNGLYEYVRIGEWEENLNLNKSLLRWRHKSNKIPNSHCSDPCRPGQRKNTKGICCWICINCPPYDIVVNETVCSECKNGSLPNSNRTECVELPVRYMSWDTAWGGVPVAVSCFGIVCSFFVLIVFLKFNSTPVIMASGRELCYVLLFGLFFCFTMTFVMIAKPSVFTCTLLRVGIGLSLSISYSAIFTKTNRLSRIFNRGIKAMVKRPSYTSPKSQLVICLCLISVQIIGDVTWLGMDLPDTQLVYPNRETVVLKCKVDNVAIVISLLYNMILIILCTVFAFKTRNIPENFNEAKYIAFTMYSTCIVWLAFIPIYFGTNNTFQIQTTALCMCISISATVALWCMFAPKVYIVIFQPHKNIRQSNSMTSKGQSGYKNGAKRAMFVKRAVEYEPKSSSVINGDLNSQSVSLVMADKAQAGGGAGDTGPSDVDSSSQCIRHPEESAFLSKFTDTSSCAELSENELRETTL